MVLFSKPLADCQIVAVRLVLRQRLFDYYTPCFNNLDAFRDFCDLGMYDHIHLKILPKRIKNHHPEFVFLAVVPFEDVSERPLYTFAGNIMGVSE